MIGTMSPCSITQICFQNKFIPVLLSHTVSHVAFVLRSCSVTVLQHFLACKEYILLYLLVFKCCFYLVFRQLLSCWADWCPGQLCNSCSQCEQWSSNIG